MTTPLRSTTEPSTILPGLTSGDRLTRAEFERRYAADPHVKKAELIEGVVYVTSPLRFTPHAEPHSYLDTWIGTYVAYTPGVRSGIEPTVRLDLDNELQPDVVLILDEAAGGKARLTADGYVEGTPELVVEIAASSAAIDSGSKKRVYRRNGVQEYIVWQSYENQLQWFQWVEGEYELKSPDQDGVIRSQVFPGLWLAVDALLDGRMADVLDRLQLGLKSKEHKRFVTQLAQELDGQI